MATTPEGPSPTPRAGSPPPALIARLAEAWRDPDRRWAVAGGGAAALLLGLIYWRNLFHFGMSWASDENYSHGFLVPLISLYFANLAAARGPVRPGGGVWLGLALLAGATLVKLATVVITVGTLGDVAFIASVAGACALLAGAGALRRYGFAIGFLAFMVPMPVALYALIASPLQLMVSQAASVVLNASGVPVLTEGNMMTLPGGVQMFVAEACSGMRQLTGFLALTAAVAYLSDRPSWYRAAVVGSSVPVAMTANVARVTLTGHIMYHVNPAYASGTYHTLEGLLMLGFGLALLRGGCWALDQVVELTRATEAAGATPDRPEPARAGGAVPPPHADPAVRPGRDGVGAAMAGVGASAVPGGGVR